MAYSKTILLVALLAACAAFLSIDSFAQTQQGAGQEDSLKKFLRDYVGDASSGNNRTTEYFPAFVDLADNGAQDAVVYLTGDGWCGSGGCTTLILAPEGSSFKIVTKITIARLPIRVLTTKSNGWHDISVVARTNGVEPTYEAKLSFNGKTYPSNPTVSPAQRLSGRIAGKTVIPLTANGAPVYQ